MEKINQMFQTTNQVGIHCGIFYGVSKTIIWILELTDE